MASSRKARFGKRPWKPATYHLDNMIAIVDCNRLQIDGWVKDVMQVEPLGAKYAAFGWEVLRIDGHNMSEIVDALEQARAVERQARW